MYAGDFPQDLSDLQRQPVSIDQLALTVGLQSAEGVGGPGGEKTERKTLQFFSQIAFLVSLFFNIF